jgi:hypothetical protein
MYIMIIINLWPEMLLVINFNLKWKLFYLKQRFLNFNLLACTKVNHSQNIYIQDVQYFTEFDKNDVRVTCVIPIDLEMPKFYGISE